MRPEFELRGTVVVPCAVLTWTLNSSTKLQATWKHPNPKP